MSSTNTGIEWLIDTWGPVDFRYLTALKVKAQSIENIPSNAAFAYFTAYPDEEGIPRFYSVRYSDDMGLQVDSRADLRKCYIEHHPYAGCLRMVFFREPVSGSDMGRIEEEYAKIPLPLCVYGGIMEVYSDQLGKASSARLQLLNNTLKDISFI